MFDLTSKTDREILKLFYQMADKPERMRAFAELDQHRHFDAQTFWSNFWGIWESSESLYLDGDIIEQLISDRSFEDAHAALGKEEVAAMAALPQTVDIFRGCSEGNLFGWSWTLEHDVAKKFSDRAHDREPIILHGRVDKSKIVGIIFGRNEAEVIVSPDDVEVIKFEKLPTVSEKTAQRMSMYQLIHEGHLDRFLDESDGGMARAKMMASMLRSSKSIEEGKAEMMPLLQFCEALNLERGKLFRNIVTLLDSEVEA